MSHTTDAAPAEADADRMLAAAAACLEADPTVDLLMEIEQRGDLHVLEVLRVLADTAARAVPKDNMWEMGDTQMRALCAQTFEAELLQGIGYPPTVDLALDLIHAAVTGDHPRQNELMAAYAASHPPGDVFAGLAVLAVTLAAATAQEGGA